MNIGCSVYNLAFVDNWIKRLSPFMPDVTFHVFNIGKLQGRDKLTNINNIVFHDISDLSSTEIICLFKKNNIELLLCFHYRSMIELLLQRIAVNLNIKQVYLEHGLQSDNSDKFKTAKAKKEIVQTIFRNYNFLKKYFGFLIKHNQRWKELLILYGIIIKNRFYLSPFDKYLIYSKRSYDMICGKFNLKNEDNIIYIGYPIFENEMKKREAKSLIKNDGGILYIHQPFILDGFATISYDEEKEYIKKLKEALQHISDKITILLHPRESIDEYIKRYKNTGINVIQSPNNFKVFADKDLIIGHYSTALLSALYFGKKTIVVEYPTAKLDGMFKDFCIYAQNVEALRNISVKEYNFKGINYLIGYFNTYEHIADTILSMKTN